MFTAANDCWLNGVRTGNSFAAAQRRGCGLFTPWHYTGVADTSHTHEYRRIIKLSTHGIINKSVVDCHQTMETFLPQNLQKRCSNYLKDNPAEAFFSPLKPPQNLAKCWCVDGVRELNQSSTLNYDLFSIHFHWYDSEIMLMINAPIQWCSFH